MDPYLKKLKERLLDHDITDDQLNDILSLYRERLNEDDPSLKDVAFEVEEIIEDHHLKLREENHRDMSTMIALYPFISIVSYLGLGFGLDFWHPGWMIFIFIPILMLVYSVFHDDFMAGLLAFIPFLIILSYFLVGFYLQLWHPTWLVFILLPIIGIFTINRKNNFKFLLFALSPILSIAIYLILGFYLVWWNRAWVVFLLVPILACIQESNKKRMIICESTLIFAMLFGFFLPFFTASWGFSFFGLFVPAIAFILLGEESLIKFTKDTTVDWVIFVIITFIYLFLGLFYDAWAYAWMMFLFVPTYEIIKQSTEHFKFYYIMPFFALALYFSLGYFYGLWFIGLTVIAIPILFYVIERD